MTISYEEAARRMQLFDWEKMRYASNRISIEHLRKLSGNSIGVTDRFKIEDKLCFSSLATLIDLERQLTYIAYCQTARILERMAGVTCQERDEIIELLSDEYAAFRATSGEVETRERIKSIERQAKEQAKQFAGLSLD